MGEGIVYAFKVAPQDDGLARGGDEVGDAIAVEPAALIGPATQAGQLLALGRGQEHRNAPRAWDSGIQAARARSIAALSSVQTTRAQPRFMLTV